MIFWKSTALELNTGYMKVLKRQRAPSSIPSASLPSRNLVEAVIINVTAYISPWWWFSHIRLFYFHLHQLLQNASLKSNGYLFNICVMCRLSTIRNLSTTTKKDLLYSDTWKRNRTFLDTFIDKWHSDTLQNHRYTISAYSILDKTNFFFPKKLSSKIVILYFNSLMTWDFLSLKFKTRFAFKCFTLVVYAKVWVHTANITVLFKTPH